MAVRILVADDEPHIVHLLTMKLTEAEYEVLTATDGEQALQICLEQRPHAVIADYRMPGLSGLELSRLLMECEPPIPVLMVTALAFEIPQSQLAAAGVAGVIAKPFSPRDVIRRLAQLLPPREQARTA